MTKLEVLEQVLHLLSGVQGLARHRSDVLVDELGLPVVVDKRHERSLTRPFAVSLRRKAWHIQDVIEGSISRLPRSGLRCCLLVNADPLAAALHQRKVGLLVALQVVRHVLPKQAGN